MTDLELSDGIQAAADGLSLNFLGSMEISDLDIGSDKIKKGLF